MPTWVKTEVVLDKYKISESTLHSWCMKGLVNFITLPGTKWRGHRRYDLEDIDKVLTKKNEEKDRD